MKNKRDEDLLKAAGPIIKTASVEITGDTANITYPEQYEAMLPESIGMDVVKKVNMHNKQYIDTVVCAVTESAKNVFKKNKKVAKVVSSFDFENNGSVNVAIEKEKTYKVPSTGESTTGPAIRTTVKSSGASGSKAYHKRLRLQLAESISG